MQTTPLFERCFTENIKPRRRDKKRIPKTVWQAIIQQNPLEIDYHSFFKAIIFFGKALPSIVFS